MAGRQDAGSRHAGPAPNPHYDFNDDTLAIGASYWVTLAEQQLSPSDTGRERDLPRFGLYAAPISGCHSKRNPLRVRR